MNQDTNLARIEPHKCINCGVTFDMCIGNPEPGDISICAACGHPTMFVEGGKVVELSETDRAELEEARAQSKRVSAVFGPVAHDGIVRFRGLPPRHVEEVLKIGILAMERFTPGKILELNEGNMVEMVELVTKEEFDAKFREVTGDAVPAIPPNAKYIRFVPVPMVKRKAEA